MMDDRLSLIDLACGLFCGLNVAAAVGWNMQGANLGVAAFMAYMAVVSK
jgi:hypothetical protein